MEHAEVQEIQSAARAGGEGDEQEDLVRLASRAVHEIVEVIKRSRPSNNEDVLATSLLRASQAMKLFERARGSHQSDGSSRSLAVTQAADSPVDDSVPWQNRSPTTECGGSPQHATFSPRGRLDPMGSLARQVIPVDQQGGVFHRRSQEPGATLSISDMGHVGL
jgi:hypothetical protein